MLTRSWAEGEVGNIDTNDPAAQEAFRRKFRAGGVGNSVLRNWQGGADAQEGRNEDRELRSAVGKWLADGATEEGLNALFQIAPPDKVLGMLEPVSKIGDMAQKGVTNRGYRNAMNSGETAGAQQPQVSGALPAGQPQQQDEYAVPSGVLSPQMQGAGVNPMLPAGAVQRDFALGRGALGATGTGEHSGGKMYAATNEVPPNDWNALPPREVGGALNGAPVSEEQAMAESQMQMPPQPQPQPQIGRSALAAEQPADGVFGDNSIYATDGGFAARKNVDEYQRAEETRQDLERQEGLFEKIMSGEMTYDDARRAGYSEKDIVLVQDAVAKTRNDRSKPVLVWSNKDKKNVWAVLETDRETGEQKWVELPGGYGAALKDSGANGAGSGNGLDGDSAAGQQGLGGRIAYNNYLARLKLPSQVITDRLKQVDRMSVDQNESIMQNVVAARDFRSTGDRVGKGDINILDEALMRQFISRSLAVLTPGEQVPSLGAGGSRLLEVLKDSPGPFGVRHLNALRSWFDGKPKDAIALKEAMGFVADVLEQQAAHTRSFAVNTLARDFKDNHPAMDDGEAWRLAESIIWGSGVGENNAAGQQGGQQGVRNVQQNWEGGWKDFNVRMANNWYKQTMDELGDDVDENTRREIALEDFGNYLKRGETQQREDDNGIFTLYDMQGNPLMFFAPNIYNTKAGGYFMEYPDPGVMAGGDVRLNPHPPSRKIQGALPVKKAKETVGSAARSGRFS